MTKCTCVWYWFIFLPYVCPFLKFLCWTINWWLCKQNITWLRQSMGKRKAETVLSDTVGYYHRSKLCCLGYAFVFSWECKTMLFTTKKKHAVTSSERAHSITWYKQKRRRNRWASKQVSWRYMSLAVLIICTDVALFWFHL